MAIRDQCLKCKSYSGGICANTRMTPDFNQRSCDVYQRTGIDLGKPQGPTVTPSRPVAPSRPTTNPVPSPQPVPAPTPNYGGSTSYGGHSVSTQMSFFDSLFSFSGRSRRSRYWLTSFFCSGIVFVCIFLGAILTGGEEGGITFGYILGVIPSFAISIANNTKRLHDLGRTGWMQLLMFVPLVNIGLGIYLAFFEGQRFDNQYGSSPY